MARRFSTLALRGKISRLSEVLNPWSGYLLEIFSVIVVFVVYWGVNGSETFYATSAQVIATMYVAVAIEYFTGDGVELDASGRGEFIFLLAVSWVGLLASIRALTIDAVPWIPSMVSAGLVASVFLVSTGLGRRVNLKNAAMVKPVVYVASFSPVLLLLLS